MLPVVWTSVAPFAAMQEVFCVVNTSEVERCKNKSRTEKILSANETLYKNKRFILQKPTHFYGLMRHILQKSEFYFQKGTLRISAKLETARWVLCHAHWGRNRHTRGVLRSCSRQYDRHYYPGAGHQYGRLDYKVINPISLILNSNVMQYYIYSTNFEEC